MSNFDRPGVHSKIAAYYTQKIDAHGPTPRGVDWNSEQAQRVRFEQITRVCPSDVNYTLLDYGCGYGALVEYLEQRRAPTHYTGFDLSESMVQSARELHAGRANCFFTAEASALRSADCTVASGIFSVQMDVPRGDWETYIEATLERMRELSRIAFSFNMLTLYSDPERMRTDLYYADPHRYFDHCRRRFSRNVALLHDYGLYEFTILVRLEA